jgi:hypothetical protein
MVATIVIYANFYIKTTWNLLGMVLFHKEAG